MFKDFYIILFELVFREFYSINSGVILYKFTITRLVIIRKLILKYPNINFYIKVFYILIF